MDLDNPLEVIVYYLLIRVILDGLGHQDEFSIVSALVYIVTHRIKLTVTHDVRLLSSYEFTNLLRCIVSQP